ncbi:Hypothetical protein, putative [Bodo saltans]|uniref:Uncharacterized protein n=1 Tax=Bodo saltans TaxID=75058 RepID=A0A0S4J9E6_BODSA|nr:Hypothetical protein, putative [Bodo saltans]|eukprot:CUG85557.1 Hypothetical protein, putative [Bodo saltans]
MVCVKLPVVDVDAVLCNDANVLREIKKKYPNIEQLFHFRKSHHVHFVGPATTQSDIDNASNEVYHAAGEPFALTVEQSVLLASIVKQFTPNTIEQLFVNAGIFKGRERFARDDKNRPGWRLSGPMYGVCAATPERRRELMNQCIAKINETYNVRLTLMAEPFRVHVDSHMFPDATTQSAWGGDTWSATSYHTPAAQGDLIGKWSHTTASAVNYHFPHANAAATEGLQQRIFAAQRVIDIWSQEYDHRNIFDEQRDLFKPVQQQQLAPPPPPRPSSAVQAPHDHHLHNVPAPVSTLRPSASAFAPRTGRELFPTAAAAWPLPTTDDSASLQQLTNADRNGVAQASDGNTTAESRRTFSVASSVETAALAAEQLKKLLGSSSSPKWSLRATCEAAASTTDHATTMVSLDVMPQWSANSC